jgi:hypothetical protein
VGGPCFGFHFSLAAYLAHAWTRLAGRGSAFSTDLSLRRRVTIIRPRRFQEHYIGFCIIRGKSNATRGLTSRHLAAGLCASKSWATSDFHLRGPPPATFSLGPQSFQTCQIGVSTCRRPRQSGLGGGGREGGWAPGATRGGRAAVTAAGLQIGPRASLVLPHPLSGSRPPPIAQN